jgi:hypothetical protein
VDLNSLLPAGSPWELNSASGISDEGTIVTLGFLNGQAHAFRWNLEGEELTLGTIGVTGMTCARARCSQMTELGRRSALNWAVTETVGLGRSVVSRCLRRIASAGTSVFRATRIGDLFGIRLSVAEVRCFNGSVVLFLLGSTACLVPNNSNNVALTPMSLGLFGHMSGHQIFRPPSPKSARCHTGVVRSVNRSHAKDYKCVLGLSHADCYCGSV